MFSLFAKKAMNEAAAKSFWMWFEENEEWIISCITNHAAGVTDAKLDHSEVVEIAARVHDTFQTLVELILTVF